MNREELYMANTYKCEELKKRLKPIVSYDTLIDGQLIYHESDNNIFNVNNFSEYTKESNLLSYKDINDKLYKMSATGWYYYDECIADEVEEMFTPKLYNVNNGILTVAFNKQAALKFVREKYKTCIGEDWMYLDSMQQIKEVDGFDVVLK